MILPTHDSVTEGIAHDCPSSSEFQDSNAPTVSVILACRNEQSNIEQCVASILQQESPPGGFEVIVADGMSEDGTREVLGAWSRGQGAGSDEGLRDQRTNGLKVAGQGWEGGTGSSQECQGRQSCRGRASLESSAPRAPRPVPRSMLPAKRPQLRFIDNAGRIVSTGLNVAIEAARGQIIVRIDAHTDYAPDYVRQCVQALVETGADNVGGPARTKAETYMQKAVAAAYHSPFAVGGARFHDVEYEGYVDTVTYGCWGKESFGKYGLFDEELVRNQDDEHNLRITRGGGKIWQTPKIKSWYRPRGSLLALFNQYKQYGYWKVRVIQKHKLPASWRHLVPGAFLLTLLALAILSFSSLGMAVLRPPSSVLDPLSLPWPLFALAALLSAYTLAVLAASIHTAARTEWKLLPLLPLVFPCYHFGYGYGFLRGVWDFVVRRRPRAAFARLTR